MMGSVKCQCSIWFARVDRRYPFLESVVEMGVWLWELEHESAGRYVWVRFQSISAFGA